MPGRACSMARRVTKLEGMVLEVYQALAKATPAIHKETELRHGVTLPTSPWVAAYRLGCEFLLAVDELGEHYRKQAGMSEEGPIRQAFRTGYLAQLRLKYQRGPAGRTLEEITRCMEAAERVHESLPDSSESTEDYTWAMANKHVDCPNFSKAPSNLAIGFWFALVTLGDSFSAHAYSIYLNKRLPRGDWVGSETR